MFLKSKYYLKIIIIIFIMQELMESIHLSILFKAKNNDFFKFSTFKKISPKSIYIVKIGKNITFNYEGRTTEGSQAIIVSNILMFFIFPTSLCIFHSSTKLYKYFLTNFFTYCFLLYLLVYWFLPILINCSV